MPVVLKLLRPSPLPNHFPFVHRVEDMLVNLDRTLLMQIQQIHVIFAWVLFAQLPLGRDFAVQPQRDCRSGTCEPNIGHCEHNAQ